MNLFLIYIGLFLTLSLSDEEERDLVLNIKNGDKSAFSKFFDQIHQPLFSYLRSLGCSKDHAKDLIQQAFIYIWENRAIIDPDKSLRSYLYRIAYTRYLNSIRDKRTLSLENISVNLEVEVSDTEDDNDLKNQVKKVMDVVKKLPKKRKMAFQLCFLEGFTYKEAAEIMNVSDRTIENHIAFALKDIRRIIKE